MRKLFASLAAASVLVGVSPFAVHALAPHASARLSTDLASSLPATGATEKLVVFVHARTSATASAAIASAGLTKVGEFQSIGVPVAIGTPKQITALATKPGVTYVEGNREVELQLETSRQAIRATEAAATPDLAFDGTGQTIAIVDGGVDGTHPMFVDPATGESKVVRNLKVACLNNTPVYFPNLAGQGQFPPDTCPQGDAAEPFLVDLTELNDTDTMSGGGHGTHVAGIAAGVEVTTADGRTFSGVAPGAKVVSISTGAAIGIYGANAALDWIVRHHDDPCGIADPVACPPITVINNSYGGTAEWDPEAVTSKLQDALLAEDVVVVWANGNGDDTDTEGNTGGDGDDNRSGNDAQHPGAGVISVANYDDGGIGTRGGTLNTSSSRGDASRAETWPDLSAPGTSITSACRPYLAICSSADADPNYGTIGGTSMAAPHVAGVVAILREANPDLTAADVEDILQDTAHKFSFGAEYEPDPQNPGGTSSFDKGAGLVDVVNALHAALGTEPTDPPAGDAGAACAPDAPLVTDPEGDATVFAMADTGENVPTLDVTTVDVIADAVAEELAIVFGIADLTESDPDGTTGISFEGTIGIGSDPYDVTAERAVAGETFRFGGTDVEGSFDPIADTVSVVVPRALLDGRVGEVTVKSLSAGISRRSYDPTPLGPLADDFAGTCPQTVDVGGAPVPPAAPDLVASAGSPATWAGEPSTAASDPSGEDLTSVEAEGKHTDSRTIDVVVDEGGTVVFDVTCDNPDTDDFDITLTGPDGKPAGVGPTDVKGSSAQGGCVEKITVTNAKPGVYTATITTFLAVSGTYSAKITVE